MKTTYHLYISAPIRLIIALAMLPLAVSCSLDEHPKDQLSEEEVYATAGSLVQNTVATLYNYIGGSADSQGLQGTVRGVYDLGELTADEAIIPTRGGDWYDGRFWQRLYLHTWTPSEKALLDTWNYLYKVIVLCNHSLAQLETHKNLLTTDDLTLYKSEVRALRAMFYYYLVDLYGRVPLVVDEDTPLNNVRQGSRSEVFGFIVDELQEVAGNLPIARSNYEGDNYGRMTAPVAWFLLAKLMLNAEVYSSDTPDKMAQADGQSLRFTVEGRKLNAWEACVFYCDKLTQMGYQLESECDAPFRVHNESSVENIFTIPMDKTLYANQFRYLFRSRHYNHGSAIGMDAENGTSATLTTVRAYGYGTTSVDNRYALNFFSDTVVVDGSVVCLDNGEPLIYRPLAVTALDLTGSQYEKTAGARMHKYEIDRTAYADGTLQDNDIVLFRYADVLLMRAEARVRNGEDGSADLNQVRRRAGMPDREATLANILDERMLELCWEGWRRQDLIRFDKFHQTYDLRPQLSEESSRYTTLFPIPDTALDLNKNLSQNPGYK